MREHLTIRDFQDGDEDGLVAVLRDLQSRQFEIYDRALAPETVGLPYIGVMKQECAEGRGRILVAEKEGVIVGFATLLTSVSMENERDEVPYTHAYVSELGVLAGSRSQGVGAALLKACEAVARDAGQRWIRLDVLATNDRARDFYARAGYGEVVLSLEKKL